MNERIIKAGLDSGMLNYVDHETPRHYFLASWATEEDLEKFAELIVQECISIVEDNTNTNHCRTTYDLGVSKAVIEKSVRKLKKFIE